VDRSAAFARPHQLLEGRQDHRSTGLLQRIGERLIGGRVRGGAEIDVKHDVARAGVNQLADQFRMLLPGPGPDANILDRRRVDRHQDDVTAGLAGKPAEPQVGQGVLQRLLHPGQQNDCQDARNQNMRSIPSHPAPRRPTPDLKKSGAR
jgi:hypothetical protein